MTVNRWQLTDDSWPMTVNRWQLTDDKNYWKVVNYASNYWENCKTSYFMNDVINRPWVYTETVYLFNPMHLINAFVTSWPKLVKTYLKWWCKYLEAATSHPVRELSNPQLIRNWLKLSLAQNIKMGPKSTEAVIANDRKISDFKLSDNDQVLADVACELLACELLSW